MDVYYLNQEVPHASILQQEEAEVALYPWKGHSHGVEAFTVDGATVAVGEE